jgi:hypothetical protein
MRLRYLLASLIIVAVIVPIFILIGYNLRLSSTVHPTNPSSTVPENPVPDPITIEDPARIAESDEAMPLSQGDVSALLENRCGQCHMTALLKQYKKSRAEWEMTFAQMEAFGLELNGEDGKLLLDFLFSIDNP